MGNEEKILNSLPWGIVQLDQTGRILSFNRSASRLTGLSQEAVRGKIYHNVLDLPVELTKAEKSSGWVIQGSQQQALSCRLLPWGDDPPEAESGWLLVLEELGESKDKLEQLLEQERLQGVKELGTTVAHKINQALQVVMGYASLMIVDLPPEHQHYGYISSIIQQMEDVRKITQKLSNISCYAVNERPDGQRLIDLNLASIS
jgi:nitrogen-specific signal transduction histidine kinase